MNLRPGESVAIETVNLGERARMEIEAAREAGVDPMTLARTHQSLGYLIPQLLRAEEKKS